MLIRIPLLAAASDSSVVTTFPPAAVCQDDSLSLRYPYTHWELTWLLETDYNFLKNQSHALFGTYVIRTLFGTLCKWLPCQWEKPDFLSLTHKAAISSPSLVEKRT